MASTRFEHRRRRVTVHAWERAVAFRDGVVLGEYGPGRYPRRIRSRWHIVDARPSQLVLAPQEILTADGLQLKISAVVVLSIVAPAKWLLAGESPQNFIYSQLQVVIRERVAARSLDELLASRADLLDGVEEALSEGAQELGARISSVDIRDIVLPSELRHAFAQTALARETGKAELERARAESASLRSLANTAKLIEDHPVLLQLRALQAGESGAQLHIRLGDAPVVP